MSDSVVAIIPVRNNVGMIGQCIKSILKDATICGLVVVCDRCTDGTDDLVEDLSNNDDRLIAIKKDWTHGGRHIGHRVSEVHNVGLKEINSQHGWNHADYVTFVGSDTMIPAGYIDKAVSTLRGDPSLGFVGIKLDGASIGTGTVMRRSILQTWGMAFPSSARDDTACHRKIIAMGYNGIFLPYHNNGILLTMYKDISISRKLWGMRGIGYAEYEMGQGLTHMAKIIIFEIIRNKSLQGIVCTIGWFEAFFTRAKKLDGMKPKI